MSSAPRDVRIARVANPAALEIPLGTALRATLIKEGTDGELTVWVDDSRLLVASHRSSLLASAWVPLREGEHDIRMYCNGLAGRPGRCEWKIEAEDANGRQRLLAAYTGGRAERRVRDQAQAAGVAAIALATALLLSGCSHLAPSTIQPLSLQPFQATPAYEAAERFNVAMRTCKQNEARAIEDHNANGDVNDGLRISGGVIGVAAGVAAGILSAIAAGNAGLSEDESDQLLAAAGITGAVGGVVAGGFVGLFAVLPFQESQQRALADAKGAQTALRVGHAGVLRNQTRAREGDVAAIEALEAAGIALADSCLPATH